MLAACEYGLNGDLVKLVNPIGRFVVCGSFADCGVTGRKLSCDTYGGIGRIGGGALSGKDPSKVDRSAAYMARKITRDIVQAGYAEQCEVQIAYAIGMEKPVPPHERKGMISIQFDETDWGVEIVHKPHRRNRNHAALGY